MKKLNALTIAAAVLALSACSFNSGIHNSDTLDEGVVTEEKAKEDVRSLYKNGVETTEKLENLDDDPEEPTDPEEPEEPTDPEEPEEPTDPEEPEEPEEPTDPEEPEEVEITSYHVDYSYEYALKASLESSEFGSFPVIDQSESETYSLTYVKAGDDVFVDMTMTHSYYENAYYSGEESIHAILQDNKLYVESSVSYGDKTYTSKDAYGIHGRHVHDEFGDYFRYTYIDFLFANGEKEATYDLLDVLLESENVTILEATEDTVTIGLVYDTFDATIVFNTELKTVVSATFDYSRSLLSLFDEFNEEYGPKVDEETGEEIPGVTLSAEEAKQIVTVNYSYNDQVANKLTEEEIAEYRSHGHGDYGHHNDHSYYDEDYHRGNHGNHDSDGWGHGKDDYDYGDDYGDWDWDYDDDEDYGDDWDWDQGGCSDDDHGHGGGHHGW